MSPFEMRPRNVGEILDAAFTLYTRNIRTLLAIAAVVLLPIGLVQIAVSGTLGNVDLFDALLVEEGRVPPGFARFVGATVLVAFLGGLGGLFVQGASIRVFAAAYQGSAIGWRPSLAFAARKALLILATAFLASLGSWLGLVLCIVPGVWLWTSWYAAIPALVVEDLGPIRSLRRSFELVARRFWPVLGVAVLAWLLTVVVDQIVAFVVNAAVVVPQAISAAGGSEPRTGVLVGAGSVAGTVVSLFTVPFLAAVAVAVYFDLRIRVEGYDLELMARELGASGDAPGPLPPADGDDPFGIDRGRE